MSTFLLSKSKSVVKKPVSNLHKDKIDFLLGEYSFNMTECSICVLSNCHQVMILENEGAIRNKLWKIVKM